MNIREDINKFSDKNDKTILNWLLDKYNMSSQFNFVAKCTHIRYGYRSYETNRCWKPTEEGYILYKAFNILK